MPKRKRADQDENSETPFRRYSNELHKRSKECTRATPSMMITPDLGQPQDVWKILCSKDEISNRNWRAKTNEHINSSHRCMLVDWIMEVCSSLKLHRETFHLTVDYWDRMMCFKDFKAEELQLLATTALHIACKVEEIYPPKLSELVEYADGACTMEEVLDCERLILTVLEWNFNPITAIHWLSLYLQLVSKTNGDAPDSIKKKRPSSPELVHEDTDDGTESNTSFSDSFLRTIDGVNTTLNESYSDSLNESFEGHVYVDQSICVPKLMRDDFVHLARVVDLLILDQRYLRYRYSEIAAAVLFCAYEPTEAVEEITSVKKEDISKLIERAQILLDYCDSHTSVIQKSYIEDIPKEDQHNIQSYEGSNWEVLKEICARQKSKKEELQKIHHAIKSQSNNVVLKEQNV